MDLPLKLQPVHACLSQALTALTEALSQTVAADNQRFHTIARLLTAAQLELLALCDESRERGRVASDAERRKRRDA
jgi:hypothetical protein